MMTQPQGTDVMRGAPDQWAWTFPLRSCRVYDADTLMDLTLDMGFNCSIVVTGRLYGINAPEMRGPEKTEGIKSRDWLRHEIDTARQVFVKTRPTTERAIGKYGRWLVTIYADGVNLNEQLVEKGLAKQASY